MQQNWIFITGFGTPFSPLEGYATSTIAAECAKRVLANGDSAIVIGTKTQLPPYEHIPFIGISHQIPKSTSFAHLAGRLNRRIYGLRYVGHKNWINAVVKAIDTAQPKKAINILLCSAEPELAVELSQRINRANIILSFQNQFEAKTRYLEAIIKSSVRICACSDFMARWVESKYGLPAGTVTTIYNGVDHSLFRPKDRALNRLPVVNFLGRTGFEKGLDVLIRALLKLISGGEKRFSLQILGPNGWDGPNPGNFYLTIKKLLAELNMHGIPLNLPGAVPPFSLPAYLREADIHVTPSRWQEPFGVATLEAMSCGLATIGSDTGGTPEIIGKSGLLFENENEKDLAEKILYLLHEPAKRMDFGNAAFERSMKFSWDETWRGYARLAY